MGDILTALTEEREALPDWNGLGPYFSPAFAKAIEGDWDVSYLYSPTRYESLKQRFQAISGEFKVDTASMCIPAQEARLLRFLTTDQTAELGLSTEQRIAVEGVYFLSGTTAGEAVTMSAASVSDDPKYENNDVIICAVNGDPDKEGFYRPDHNLATFDLHFQRWDQEQQKIVKCDATHTVLGSSSQFGNVLGVLAEELTHAYQNNSKKIWEPTQVADGNPFHSRPDEKLWNMFVEGHAKVVAANMMVQMAMNKTNSDGTISRGRPDFLNSFLQNWHDGTDAEIVRTVMSLHMQYGAEAIKNDPSLLWPAYEVFFAETGDSYFSQFGEYLNEVIDPQDYDRLDIDHIIRAFGEIPGMKGNGLAEVLFGKRPEDIAAMLDQDSEMAQWFNENFNAMAEGRPISDLPVTQAQTSVEPPESEISPAKPPELPACR